MQGVRWIAETPGLLSARLGEPESGVRRYLLVEALPTGGWDWVVWIADGSGRSLTGTAATRAEAMEAAELGTRRNRPVPPRTLLARVPAGALN